MKNILWVVLAVLIALGIQNFVLPKNASTISKTETAYDRVMRANTLHCAYAIYPPWLDKDPNTGKLSGIMPDVMAAFEQASGIKVEWGPEIDWGNIAATLQASKADAFCAGMFLTPKRGRVLAGSTPLYYTTVEAFARPDDARFDNNPDRINQTDVRIAVNLGDLSEEVAQRLFPKAKLVYKSSMGGEAELFLNVATNKADITLSGPSNLSAYNLNNPTTALRKVEFPHPLVTFQGVLAMDIHEAELQKLIDASLYNLINSGMIVQILQNHLGKDYGVFYFPPKPQFN